MQLIDFQSLVNNLLFLRVQRYEIFCNSQLFVNEQNLYKGCFCECKDTKFFAIHNPRGVDASRRRVVSASAKIRNFLQFTTYGHRCRFSRRCFCECKDTKFFAIHNNECRQLRLRRVVSASAKIRNFLQFTTLYHAFKIGGRVVSASAKIRNFLQFTTRPCKCQQGRTLFLRVQRYEIFCNSQPMQACRYRPPVVSASAKIRNFLQFTTNDND